MLCFAAVFCMELPYNHIINFWIIQGDDLSLHGNDGLAHRFFGYGNRKILKTNSSLNTIGLLAHENNIDLIKRKPRKEVSYDNDLCV